MSRDGEKVGSVVLWMIAGCATNGVPGVRPPTTAEISRAEARRKSAAPAIEALRAGRFDAAVSASAELIAKDEAHPEARAVSAIGRYRAAADRLWTDVRTTFAGALIGRPNHRFIRQSLEETAATLTDVEGDLAVASREVAFELELCLACWEVDWNQTGEVDEGDRRLFEVELDVKGIELAEGDPRRRPTFRLDRGDVFWARAMIAFQRAALETLLAYEWSDIDPLLDDSGDRPTKITIHVRDPSRLAKAHALILAGLENADRSRREYLAEVDDDREWVPSPKQKSHAVPLPVDDRLYETWASVLADAGRLMRGEEGVPLAVLMKMSGEEGAVEGFIDLSKVFLSPSDFVVDLEAGERSLASAIQTLLGRAYSDSMPPTPLVSRLERMKSEVDRGEDSFEKKLRYLIWLN